MDRKFETNSIEYDFPKENNSPETNALSTPDTETTDLTGENEDLTYEQIRQEPEIKEKEPIKQEIKLSLVEEEKKGEWFRQIQKAETERTKTQILYKLEKIVNEFRLLCNEIEENSIFWVSSEMSILSENIVSIGQSISKETNGQDRLFINQDRKLEWIPNIRIPNKTLLTMNEKLEEILKKINKIKKKSACEPHENKIIPQSIEPTTPPIESPLEQRGTYFREQNPEIKNGVDYKYNLTEEELNIIKEEIKKNAIIVKNDIINVKNDIVNDNEKNINSITKQLESLKLFFKEKIKEELTEELKIIIEEEINKFKASIPNDTITKDKELKEEDYINNFTKKIQKLNFISEESGKKIETIFKNKPERRIVFFILVGFIISSFIRISKILFLLIIKKIYNGLFKSDE